MHETPNPYEAPTTSSERRQPSQAGSFLLLAGLALLAVIAAFWLGRVFVPMLGPLGIMCFLGCFVWLNVRAVKDGAVPDALLLLTGISLISYIFTNWNRARWPFLGTIGGLVMMLVAAGLH